MSIFEDFSKIADGISDFASGVGKTASSIVDGVADIAAETVDVASDFVEGVADVVSGATETVVSVAETAFSYAGDKLEEATNAIVSTASSVLDDVVDTATDIKDWAVNTAWPSIKNLGEKIGDVLENTAATILLMAQSLVEGVLEFGEALADLVVIVRTAVASIPTGIYDGAQALWGLATGNEWESVTKKMWDKTTAYVAEEQVKNLFDSLYNNTEYGKWIKNNAYGYETVRSLGAGIGYVAGVVALTIVTFGAGGVAVGGAATAGSTAVTSGQLAITAGAAAFGKGAEKAWGDGAGILEGLGYAGGNAVWEGLQFYVGGKIGGSNLFSKLGADKLSVKALNIFSRIVLDGADGGVEGFVQPLLQAIYKDKSYKELFEENGGWNAVATNAKVGAVSSAIGEAFDLRKFFKNKDVTAKLPDNNINVTDIDIDSKLKRYNELNDILNSKEYLEYMDNAEKGYAQVLRPDFDSAAKEFAALETELNDIQKFKPDSFDDVTDIDIDSKLKRYNELNDILNSKEYLEYMDNAEKGYAQVLRPDFDSAAKEFAALKTEMTDTKFIQSIIMLSEEEKHSLYNSLDSSSAKKLREILDNRLNQIVENEGYNLKKLGELKGTSSEVDPKIQQYSDNLAKKVRNHAEDVEPIITSTLKKFEDTAQLIQNLDNKKAKDIVNIIETEKVKEYSVLVGLEAKLKGIGSLSRKILGDATTEGITLDSAASEIGDSVRYTMLIDDSNYVSKMSNVLDSLTSQGYKVKKFKNYWGDELYQGVNANLISPDGTTFELQFHTVSSFNTKEFLNHEYYEIIRNKFIKKLANSTEINSLATSIQKINQSQVVVPKGIIGYNYSK